MKQFRIRFLVVAAATAAGGSAAAQSPDYMVEDCGLGARQFFQDFDARTEAAYEGQRTDGTHAVNGTIYLENRSADYQCSYNAAGDTMVGFVAEGRDWPAFVRGEGSPYQTTAGGGSSAENVITGRIEFRPGTTSAGFAAQAQANTTLRYQLRARNGQFLDVRIAPADAPLVYRILNPDGSELLGEMALDRPYRGQLWQTGDHVVEVINRTRSTVPFEISFDIE